MATRVYELAKKFGITSKELVELLKEKGYTVTPIGVVPEDAIALVEKHFGKPQSKKEALVTKPEPKKEVSQEKKIPTEVKAKPAETKPIESKPIEFKRPLEKPQKPEPVQPRPAAPTPPASLPGEIVLEPMTVGDIALKARKQVSEVILTLLKQGVVATKNQLLPEKTVAQLAELYGLTVVQKKVAEKKKASRLK